MVAHQRGDTPFTSGLWPLTARTSRGKRGVVEPYSRTTVGCAVRFHGRISRFPPGAHGSEQGLAERGREGVPERRWAQGAGGGAPPRPPRPPPAARRPLAPPGPAGSPGCSAHTRRTRQAPSRAPARARRASPSGSPRAATACVLALSRILARYALRFIPSHLHTYESRKNSIP